MGESPTKRAFNSQHIPETSETNNDGRVDSIRHFLFTDNFTKPYSHEHILVHLLTTNNNSCVSPSLGCLEVIT